MKPYPHGFWSKGHHPLDVFLAKAQDELRERQKMVELGNPVHSYWRFVPVGSGDTRVVWVVAKPGVRGAFPVTLVIW